MTTSPNYRISSDSEVTFSKHFLFVLKQNCRNHNRKLSIFTENMDILYHEENKLMCAFWLNYTRPKKMLKNLLFLRKGGGRQFLPLLPLQYRPDPPHPRKLEDQVRETIHDLILVVHHAQPRINKI